jgi:hypothetical protein
MGENDPTTAAGRQETSTRHQKVTTNSEESDGTSKRAVQNKGETRVANVEQKTEEGDRGVKTQEHHKGNEETEYNRMRSRNEGGDAGGQGGNSKKSAKSEGQRMSNTWGKQNAKQHQT